MPASAWGGIVAVYAHPDDESFGPAGTLARYAAAGVPVALICATRGEAGELGDPPVATRATLGDHRAGELRRAADAIGIGPIIFLGYRDGLLGEADPAELADRVAAELGRLAPAVVITFGPHGVNGHADHVAIHRATLAAFDALQSGPDAPRALYYTAFPPDLARERGVTGPEAQPTTAIATGPFLAAKLAALAAHDSQTDAREMLARLRRERPRVERYHRARPPLPAGETEEGLYGLVG